jgi:hypothetical protein
MLTDAECDALAAKTDDPAGEYEHHYESTDYEKALMRAAYAAGLERAAKECLVISSDKWAQYKGHLPYEPMNPNRANPQTQGESDGAAICAAAIRALINAPAPSAAGARAPSSADSAPRMPR